MPTRPIAAVEPKIIKLNFQLPLLILAPTKVEEITDGIRAIEAYKKYFEGFIFVNGTK